LLGYVPMALKVFAGFLGIAALLFGYHAAASAALFQIRSVDIVGTSRTSAEEMETLVRRAAALKGVWRADLNALSAELQRLPGVRRAVVTRVLPDRLRIRIVERTPVAVVRTTAGNFIWVDDEGISLGEMKSTDQMPPFFIRGWNEEGSDDVAPSNAARVQKYLELAREWQTAGIAERVSEINLMDLRDIRAQLAGDDSQIEVRLHEQDFTQRLKNALDVLDGYKGKVRSITYLDSQSGRVTVGVDPGTHAKTTLDAPDTGPNVVSSLSTAKSERLPQPSNRSSNIGDSQTAAKRNRSQADNHKKGKRP
jgi:cell division protein FtsQ